MGRISLIKLLFWSSTGSEIEKPQKCNSEVQRRLEGVTEHYASIFSNWKLALTNKGTSKYRQLASKG